MDNTGVYLTYDELLGKLFQENSNLVTSATTVLSNKTVDSGGDFFDFVGGSPLVGDVLYQLGNTGIIIDVSGGTLQIDKTGVANLIVNGAAVVLHSDTVDRGRGEAEIALQSIFVDQQTRQWFNSRVKTIRIEGKNSNVLLLPVPILDVTSIKLNNDTNATNLSLFEIFKNRDGIPDDRRNPRIKILTFNNNIFQASFHTTFHRGQFSEIAGNFGFLEPDGSTPLLIKRAVCILVVRCLTNPLSETATVGNVGPKKREKVDLHETEYFEPGATGAGAASSKVSGSVEADRILKMYRGPMGIGGSILDITKVEDPVVHHSDIEHL